ncbi:hypothetical protein [Qipengyuania nanhaisediminis]|uniref:hypothetical protein n=1 Tax=Qipengyuania nanhaisediminis TaxID=604088 RepID=UPI0038B2B3A2
MGADSARASALLIAVGRSVLALQGALGQVDPRFEARQFASLSDAQGLERGSRTAAATDDDEVGRFAIAVAVAFFQTLEARSEMPAEPVCKFFSDIRIAETAPTGCLAGPIEFMPPIRRIWRGNRPLLAIIDCRAASESKEENSGEDVANRQRASKATIRREPRNARSGRHQGSSMN